MFIEVNGRNATKSVGARLAREGVSGNADENQADRGVAFAGKPRSYKDSVKPAGARLAREEALTSTTNPRELHFTDDGCALNPQNATIPAIIEDIACGRCR